MRCPAHVLLGVALLASLLTACPQGPEDAGDRPAPAPLSVGEFRALLDETDLWQRTAGLAQRLPSAGPEVLAEVRAALKQSRRRLGSVEGLLLVSHWAEREPAEATRWVLQSSPPAQREAWAAAAARVWARLDPAEAVRALDLTGAYGNPASLMIALVSGWAESGQPGLEDYIRDLGPSMDRQRAVANYLRARLRRDDPASVQAWAEATAADADPRYRRTLFRQLASELAALDPALGIAWCERHCDAPHGDAIRQLVATRWARYDAVAPLQWLDRSPEADPRQRSQALRPAFAVALETDRAAALAWIEALSQEQRRETWRQPAIAIYVNAISQERPEDALRWTALLRSDEERELARIAVAQRWRALDAPAADAWLDASDWPEALRARARTAPPPRMMKRSSDAPTQEAP